MHQKNLSPASVGGDDNCLFRTFSLALFEAESLGDEGYSHSITHISLLSLFEHPRNDNQLLFWLSHSLSTADTSFLNMTDIQIYLKCSKLFL